MLPPGAREIRDPDGEVQRLADARAASETLPVKRADLECLLAAAGLYLEESGPEGEMAPQESELRRDLEAVVQRYGRRH
jgi:hypothetical protein